MNWTVELLNKVEDFCHSGYTNAQIANKLKADGLFVTKSAVKHVCTEHHFSRGNRINGDHGSNKDEEESVKQDIDYNDDQTIRNARITYNYMSFRDKKKKTPKQILKYAGYDPDKWILVSAHPNEWTVTSANEAPKWNFQFKISIKPKTTDTLSANDIINLFNKKIEPVKVIYDKDNDYQTNLVIPLADMHWSEMFYEDYEPYLKKIKRIVSKGYKTIVIEQIGDLFDSDKINSAETVKGTQLESNNMPRAIKDAAKFFFDLIPFCITHSNQFMMKYQGGNHSFDTEYLFEWALQQKYPDADIELNNGYRNAYLLDDVGIIISHGDYSEKKIPTLFPVEFKEVYSNAKWTESHSGHLHYLKNEDMNGLMFRQFPTPVKGNSWNYKMGLTMAHKFMEIIEYYPDKPKEVYYI